MAESGKHKLVSAAGQPVTESGKEPHSEHLKEVKAQPTLNNGKQDPSFLVTICNLWQKIVMEVDWLKVCGVNGESIPYDGWVPIMINLPGGEETHKALYPSVFWFLSVLY